MIELKVRLSDPMGNKLKQYSLETGNSMVSIVRQAVVNFFKRI